MAKKIKFCTIYWDDEMGDTIFKYETDINKFGIIEKLDLYNDIMAEFGMDYDENIYPEWKKFYNKMSKKEVIKK